MEEVVDRWTTEKFTPSSTRKMDARASRAAALFDPGASVLDVGCGAQPLRKYLPAGCTYLGVDLIPLADDVIRIDLDAFEWPEGTYRFVAMLGLLPWIKEKRWALERARQCGERLVLTRSEPMISDGDGDGADVSLLDRLLTETNWKVESRIPSHVWNGKRVEILRCL